MLLKASDMSRATQGKILRLEGVFYAELNDPQVSILSFPLRCNKQEDEFLYILPRNDFGLISHLVYQLIFYKSRYSTPPSFDIEFECFY